MVRLGEGYSIATRYTSFIVLENDAEYKRWRIKRRNVLLVDRDLKAHAKLLKELENMRSESLASLGPQAAAKSAPAPQAQRQIGSPQPQVDRSWDIDAPRWPRLGGGGGPVGPFVLVIVGAMATARIARRRKESK